MTATIILTESTHWHTHTHAGLVLLSLLQFFVLFLLFLGYEGQTLLLVFAKVIMAEALTIFGVARLGEIVHVQLAHKTGKVVVLEVARQHFFCKFVGFVDDKSSAIVVPTYSFSVCRVLSTEKS